MKYCSEGEYLLNSSCIRNVSTIFDFKFSKNTDSYSSDQVVLYLGENNSSNPNDDQLQPWLLWQRGLYFNNSQATIESLFNTQSVHLSNTHSFAIYLNLLTCCGSILELADNTSSFLSLKSEILNNSTVLKLEYSVSDFYGSETVSVSVNISTEKWFFVTWSLNFSSPDLKLYVYLNKELCISASFENRVYNQPLSSDFSVGKSSLSYLTGYIHRLSLYSYSIDHNTLNLDSSSINCKANEYSLNLECFECNPSCHFGCSHSQSCKTHPDLLCSSFDDIEEDCTTCVSLTLNNRPCECKKNSIYSSDADSCVCDKNYFLANEECQMCTRWLSSSDIQAFFTKNFAEIRINFNISIFKVDCREIISKSDLEKFGSGWKCKMSDQKSVLYSLGDKYSITNESISFISEKLKGIDPECGFLQVSLTSDLFYSYPLPKPTAVIKAASTVFHSCENLTVDGSLSFGSFKELLRYKWEFSGIPEIEKYSNDYGNKSIFNFQSSDLATGTLTVVLSVKNRFGLNDSARFLINLIGSVGIVPIFDSSIKYSCLVSETCQFFITKISTCIENPIFSFNWELTEGESLLNETNRFWEQQTPGDSILIPKGMFPPSIIKFEVTVFEETSQVFGNETLQISIEPEDPVIIIKNVSGMISTLKDLLVDASESYDPNSGELTFLWSCLGICNFSYTSDKSSLFISKKIVKARLFDAFVLNVSSTVSLKGLNEKVVKTSQAFFSGEFVDRLVPSVSIIETFQRNQPKRFVISKDASLTALVSGDYFETEWVLKENDKNLVKSGESNSAVVIDMSLTVPGGAYKLLFLVKDESFTYNFFYEFTANQPPKIGYFSVSPSEGLEIQTTFNFQAVDWLDEEEDYPLAFSFGYLVEGKKSFLSEKSQKNSFETVFSYLGESLEALCQVFDSLDDFIEVTEKFKVSIDPNFSSNDFLEETSKALTTSLLKDYPSLLGNLINGVLNRELITSDQNSTSEATLQSAFDNCTYYLSIYSLSIYPSSYVTDQMISLLDSLTANSKLSSVNNSLSINEITNFLLTRSNSAEIALSSSQGSGFLKIMTNSGKVTSESALNQTKLMTSITSVIDQVSKGTLLGTVDEQQQTLSSTQITVDVFSSKSTSINGMTLKSSASESVSIALPSGFSKNLPENVGVSVGFVNVENTGNSSSGTILGLSLFSKTQATPLQVNLKASFLFLTIPVDKVQQMKNLSCVYLDNEREKWSTKGCKLVKTNEDSAVCQCNHLTFFSSREKFSKFVPDSNIDQTVNVESLKNINATNAIGFYFSLGIIIVYIIFMILTVKKDKQDLNELHELIDLKFSAVKNHEKSDPQDNFNTLNEFDLNSKHLPKINSKYTEESPSQIEINKEVSSDTLKGNQESEQTKSRIITFLESHEFLSLFYLRDPLHTRSLRCTLIFTVFLGKMFFIGLFYKGESKKSSGIFDSIKNYTFQDFLVMVYSSAIMSVLVQVLPAIFKDKPLNFNLSKPENLIIIKRNKIVNLVLIIVYCIVMAYFCWSISLFALNLPTGTSYMWIFNTITAILVRLFIISVILILMKLFVISKVAKWIEKNKKDKEMRDIEQSDLE